MEVTLQGSDHNIRRQVSLWGVADRLLRVLEQDGPPGVKGVRLNLAEVMTDVRLEWKLRGLSDAEQRRIHQALSTDNTEVLSLYIKQLEAEL